MTIQEKVKSMHVRMAELRDSATSERKARCFALLHDAVIHTGPRIDTLNNNSLVGYIELAARTVTEPDMYDLMVRNKLLAMGFSTSPAN